MQSVRSQRWTGGLLLLVGLGFTIWQWLGQAASGPFALEATFAFPFFAVLGLLLLAFPISRRELLERFGVDRPQSLSHYTPAQRALLVLAIAAGGANLAAHQLLR